MKKKIILGIIMAALGIASYMVGVTCGNNIVEKNEQKVLDDYMMKEEFRGNYLDMRTVTDFQATEYGIMLYTDDGSGYLWEREAEVL